jgi:hypothetical protein
VRVAAACRKRPELVRRAQPAVHLQSGAGCRPHRCTDCRYRRVLAGTATSSQRRTTPEMPIAAAMWACLQRGPVAFDDQHPAMHAQTSVTVGHRASWVVERALRQATPHPGALPTSTVPRRYQPHGRVQLGRSPYGHRRDRLRDQTLPCPLRRPRPLSPTREHDHGCLTKRNERRIGCEHPPQ